MDKKLQNFFEIENNSKNFSGAYNYYPNYNPGIIARTSYRARNAWDSLPTPVKGIGMGVGAYALWKNRNHIGAGIDQAKDLAAQGRDKLMNQLGTDKYMKGNEAQANNETGEVVGGRTYYQGGYLTGGSSLPTSNNSPQKIEGQTSPTTESTSLYKSPIGPGLSEQSKNFKHGISVPQQDKQSEQINSQEEPTSISNKSINPDDYENQDGDNTEDIDNGDDISDAMIAFSLKNFFNTTNNKEISMLNKINKYYENKINPVLGALRNFSENSNIKTEMKLTALNALTGGNDINIKNRAMNILNQEYINEQQFSENHPYDNTQNIYELNEKLIRNFNDQIISNLHFSKENELDKRFGNKKDSKSNTFKTLGIAALAAGGAGTGAFLSDKNRIKAENELEDVERNKDYWKERGEDYFKNYIKSNEKAVLLQGKIDDLKEENKIMEEYLKQTPQYELYKKYKEGEDFVNKEREKAAKWLQGNPDNQENKGALELIREKDTNTTNNDADADDDVMDGNEFFSFKEFISNNTNNSIFY